MREVKLTGKGGIGKFVMVDDDIYEKIRYKDLRYRAGKERSDYIYWTEEKNGKYIHVRLHKYVYGKVEKEIMVDHIDTNPLNCQRDNLRPATRAENNQNRKSFKNSSSMFKGVGYDKGKKKWRAQIGVNKRLFFIGYFDDMEEAAHNYDWHAKRMHKEFALLNFPDFSYDDFQPKKRELK